MGLTIFPYRYGDSFGQYRTKRYDMLADKEKLGHLKKHSATAILAILTCCPLGGCHTSQPHLITRDVLIGSYVYKSQDPEDRLTDHEWDHLTLQADGKYDLVQGGPTKPRTETVGVWTLWPGGGNGPRVILDHSGYPIQIDGNEVRLLIDDDTGIWYAKAR